MVQLRSANFLLALLLSVSVVSAGPSCARKHRGSKDCVARCRQHFGWPGKGMGNDPWGPVMDPNNHANSDDVASSACGSPTSSQIPQATQPAQAPGSDPATAVTGSSAIEATSTTKLASSSSSKTQTSSSSVKSGAQFAPTHSTATSSSSSITTSKSRLTTIRTSSSNPKSTPTTTKAPETTEEPRTTTKVPSIKPPPVTTSASSSSGGSTSGSDIDRFLAAHNSVRAQHGASALGWDQSLADAASKWAKGCLFKHSGGVVGPFGENLAAGTSSKYQPEDGIKQWADEAKDYNPANPNFSHFTQMVWKSTTKVGCVLIRCPALKFEDGNSWDNSGYLVCEYSPAGNVLGQFDQNVQA